MTETSLLFQDIVVNVPRTEGIKYAGSKLKILPHILNLANEVDANTVLDGFSGTTRVSQAFAKSGYAVISNDTSIWSEVFANCYLLNQKPPTYYRPLIEHLNAVVPIDGWFTKHYGGYANDGCSVQSDGRKRPWQIHNTRKLDGIRAEIENMSLSLPEKSVALTSLMLALDKVDNSIGHFASYLREWAPRSYNNLELKVPALFQSSAQHQVFRGDIFDLAPRVAVDLAYFDPPYGSNNEKMPPSRLRYGSYYHLWMSVCLFDKPDLFGKSMRRSDCSDPICASVFEEFRKNGQGKFIAVDAIDRLIKMVDAHWVILSYSSGGRATAEEINNVIENHGQLLKVVNLSYQKNVMAGMKWTNKWLRDVEEPNTEFLFLIEK